MFKQAPGVLRRAALAGLVLLAGPALAASPAKIEAPPPGALSCGGCHPATPAGVLPSLSGRPAGEIVVEMQAFRDGGRKATVMDRIAKGFSDDEMRAIADWLAARDAAPGSPAPKP